eukprot:s1153_g7.t2
MALANEDQLRALVLAATFMGLHLLISAQDTPGLQMALAESRKANFFQFARFGSFVGAGALCYFMYVINVNPRPSEWSCVLATLVMYIQFTAISTRMVELTIGRVQFSCSCFYGVLILCYLELPFIEEAYIDSKPFDINLTACRFIMAAVALNTRFSLPWQVLLSLGQLWADFNGPSGVRHPFFCVFLQGVVLGLTILGSHTLETCVRSNIRAQFDCSDAESLMYSFRGMLRGICDGEALLDSNLRIHVVSDCLKHLLMTSTNLHGKSFQQLLDPEDLEKFRQFMEASASNIPPNMSTPHMPPCLRVSLLGAASTRIAVDLFHVPISKLYGSHDPYHLIALKEDCESRAPPESRMTGPEFQVAQPPKMSRTDSDGSAATGTGLQGLFHELTEMSLLVDGSTPFCDVRQVILRFRHSPLSQIPSLRAMVLPTQWATVHGAVMQFMESQEEGSATQSSKLPPMRCRMIDQSSKKYNIAHLAEILPHRGGGKLWLRLGELEEGTGSREQFLFQTRDRRSRRGALGAHSSVMD